MPTVHLPKKFGLLNAISINMSNMVGTGPFITVPAILATMGGPQALVCWFVGAVIAIADGLVFAELGTTFPSSGGSYTYLRECFGREGLGRLMAWLFVWQFLFSGPLEIASGYIGFSSYLGYLWKVTPLDTKLIACALGLLNLLLLYRPIKTIGALNVVFMVGTLLTTGPQGSGPLRRAQGKIRGALPGVWGTTTSLYDL